MRQKRGISQQAIGTPWLGKPLRYTYSGTKSWKFGVSLRTLYCTSALVDRDELGRHLSKGIYFCEFEFIDFDLVKKLIKLR